MTTEKVHEQWVKYMRNQQLFLTHDIDLLMRESSSTSLLNSTKPRLPSPSTSYFAMTSCASAAFTWTPVAESAFTSSGPEMLPDRSLSQSLNARLACGVTPAIPFTNGAGSRAFKATGEINLVGGNDS